MLTIEPIGPDQLSEYAAVSIAFEVRAILRATVVEGGFGGITLHEEAVTPYRKDYDAYGEGRPQDWPHEFDVTNWAFFLAREGERAVGAAAVAWDTPAAHMLEGRRDLAVLWDLRVQPEARGRGVGHALFQQTAEWARAHGCIRLKVETQNINVAACRFYARQGCALGSIHRFAYWGHPMVADEVMLLWYKTL